jgi:hypothetical protein
MAGWFRREVPKSQNVTELVSMPTIINLKFKWLDTNRSIKQPHMVMAHTL